LESADNGSKWKAKSKRRRRGPLCISCGPLLREKFCEAIRNMTLQLWTQRKRRLARTRP